MGISGLLNFLKTSGRPISVRELSGQTVAVDTYCWLHRGAFACAEKLGMQQDTDQYVHYCMKYVRLLLAHRIRVILVFDGKNLPAKAAVEQKRRENRAANKRRAIQLMAEGKLTEAREAFERCIDVTPAMALAVMQAARREGVDTIVAPYEADAQLTHLCNAGLVDAVISEDSDLLPFGCRRVVFKMDNQGNGYLVERSEIAKQLGIPESEPLDEVGDAKVASSGPGMTWSKFRWMCILSGCDYYPGVPGIGLTTAAGIVRRTCLDLRGLASKLFLYAKKVQRLTKDQIEAIVRADMAFLHQVVFDPIQGRQCRLIPLPPRAESSNAEAASASLDFAGSVLADDELALQLAHGNVDFRTLQPVACFDPADPANTSSSTRTSIWATGEAAGSARKGRSGRKVASDAAMLEAMTTVDWSPYFSSAGNASCKPLLNSTATREPLKQPLWRTSSSSSSLVSIHRAGESNQASANLAVDGGSSRRRGQKRSSQSGSGQAAEDDDMGDLNSVEKLRRLYHTESSGHGPAAVNEQKENSADSECSQGDDFAAAAPKSAPPAITAADLRRPEFRLFGGSLAQQAVSSPSNSKPPASLAALRPQQTVLSRYFPQQQALQHPPTPSKSPVATSGNRHRLFPVPDGGRESSDCRPSQPAANRLVNTPFKPPSEALARFSAQPPSRLPTGDDVAATNSRE